MLPEALHGLSCHSGGPPCERWQGPEGAAPAWAFLPLESACRLPAAPARGSLTLPSQERSLGCTCLRKVMHQEEGWESRLYSSGALPPSPRKRRVLWLDIFWVGKQKMLVLLLTLPVTSTISQGPPAPGQPCALWGPRHTAGGGGRVSTAPSAAQC